ncbi:hypothetical protein T4D_14805 [Trichinella pseudospiralis]|uniref:Uncharacterized protein n=1 Tax=Trichinella pseudospiralis TaxID=6337 RepID=A0A0V1DR80_TRIPS|nr:hypothetical protein T4D_14805 [Trichinella pseudospiralis]
MSCKSYGKYGKYEVVLQDSTVILKQSYPLVRKLRLRRIGVTDPSRVDQVC